MTKDASPEEKPKGEWVRHWTRVYTTPFHLGLSLDMINGAPSIVVSIGRYRGVLYFDPYPDEACDTVACDTCGARHRQFHNICDDCFDLAEQAAKAAKVERSQAFLASWPGMEGLTGQETWP